MAVTEFRLSPNEGLHPLLLGMTAETVESALGEVPKKAKSRLLPTEEVWLFEGSSARASIRDGRLVEVSITPPAKVWLHGQDLFENSGLWRELVAADGDAHDILGFLVLQRLGLALTGFHDEDQPQLAVTAFEPGRWDRLAGKRKPFTA